MTYTLQTCLLLLSCPFILSLLPSTLAKIEEGRFSLGTRQLHYLTKFGCSIGSCEWKIRTRLIFPNKPTTTMTVNEISTILQNSSPTTARIQLMLDETWDSSEVNKRPTCGTMKLARVSKTIPIPVNGEWSDWQVGSINQHIRPHVWYFVMDDCNGVISEYMANRLKLNNDDLGILRFQWEFQAWQPNGSHFSYELFGTFGLAVFHSLCYLVVLLLMAIHQVREMKKTGRMHQMVQMLNVCVLTQMSSSLLHLTHLFTYSFNGYGIPSIDGIAEALAVVSQIVMSSVMIFIALGYTLSVPNSATRVEAIALPIVLVVTILHVGLVYIDRFNADPRFKFHSADGFLGFTLALLRLVLWGGFISQCISTICRYDTSPSVRGFLRRFMVAGSLYFLAYPIVFLVTCLFAPYLQHKVITNGIFLMQLGSMLWLCSLFLRKGEYFKISELSQSYLPGGYLCTRGVHRLD